MSVNFFDKNKSALRSDSMPLETKKGHLNS